MSDKHTDDVAGMKVGHGDIPKFLYPVYIGLLLWAAYYFIVDNGYNGYSRPAVDTKTYAGIKQTKNCDLCHLNTAAGYPDLNKTKEYFATKEDLMKYLEDPTKVAPVTTADKVVLMAGIAAQLTPEEKQIIADELYK